MVWCGQSEEKQNRSCAWQSSKSQAKCLRFFGIVIGWVEADGELTLPELADRLAAEHGVTVHPTSLSRLLKAAGFTFKKNPAGQRDRSR